MEKIARKLKDHYIVCGLGRVGRHIVGELCTTSRPCVMVESDSDKITRTLKAYHDQVLLQGDATENEILLKAGIERAAGVFAVTGDDNHNLVIALTAKQLNPSAKVVASCKELHNMEKVKKAGADAVISPTHIGALRMASEMLRPMVVSFLDTMLRNTNKNLRIEEISLNPRFHGKSVRALNLNKYSQTLLLAIKTREDWIFHPPGEYSLQPDDKLIVMTTPEERNHLEKEVDNSVQVSP